MDERRRSNALLPIAAVAISALALAAPVFAGRGAPTAGAPATSQSQEHAMNGITVRGVGRITMAPDMATLTIGANVRAETAAAAHAGASQRMSRIIAALRRLGIAEGDITTQNVSLMPTFDYDGKTERPSGFQASQSAQVKIRDLGRVGQVIDAGVDAGANELGGIAFSVEDQDAAMARAREAAVTDARRHAETLARAAGVSVGGPVAIREGPSAPPPPIVFERAVAADATAPIEPGTLELTVDVEVTYAIG